jgi:hypothetical protein
MANEFVARKGIISLGGLTFPYQQTSVSYTGQTDDFFIDAIQSGITITLPDSTNLEGKQFVVKNSSLGNITITGYSGQSISGLTNENLGSNNTAQFVSNNGTWVIGQVSGPVRTATNNSLLTSDGTIGGVDANSGLTFDGQTLRNLVPQTSATTYLESYSYEITGFSSTTAFTKIFQIPKTNVNLLDIDYMYTKGSAVRAGVLRRFIEVTGQTNPTSTVTFGTGITTGIYISADTTDYFVIARVTSGSEVLDKIGLNAKLVKYN